MYGTEAGLGSATLAATGLAAYTGSWIIAGVCLILAGVSLWMLVRKESKVKP